MSRSSSDESCLRHLNGKYPVPTHRTPLGLQMLEERSSSSEVGRVEALLKPAVRLGEKVLGIRPSPTRGEESGETQRGAQAQRMLRAGAGEALCPHKTLFRLVRRR